MLYTLRSVCSAYVYGRLLTEASSVGRSSGRVAGVSMPTTAPTNLEDLPVGSSKRDSNTPDPSTCPFNALALSSRISKTNFAAVVVSSLQADLSDPSAVLEDGVVLLSQNAIFLSGLRKGKTTMDDDSEDGTDSTVTDAEGGSDDKDHFVPTYFGEEDPSDDENSLPVLTKRQQTKQVQQEQAASDAR